MKKAIPLIIGLLGLAASAPPVLGQDALSIFRIDSSGTSDVSYYLTSARCIRAGIHDLNGCKVAPLHRGVAAGNYALNILQPFFSITVSKPEVITDLKSQSSFVMPFRIFSDVAKDGRTVQSFPSLLYGHHPDMMYTLGAQKNTRQVVGGILLGGLAVILGYMAYLNFEEGNGLGGIVAGTFAVSSAVGAFYAFFK